MSLSSPSRLLAYQQPSSVRADRPSPSMDVLVVSVLHPVCSAWSYPVSVRYEAWSNGGLTWTYGPTSVLGWLSKSDHGATFLTPLFVMVELFKLKHTTWS